MLTFVGLGLFDNHDVSEKGRAIIAGADVVYLEWYTSRLMGSSHGDLEQYYNRKIHLLSREDVEGDPEELLLRAESASVAFLTAGDPMVSTTHVDLRIRAAERGITTSVIHGASISSAICGLSGLQNYRFGKSCSLPFPQKNWFPLSTVEVIADNLARNLHTLVYLDIQDDRHMAVHEAVDLLEAMAAKKKIAIPLYVGIARAGSDHPVIGAGPADRIRNIDFGPPLHILIVPAQLHDMEKKYLEVFAGL